MRSVGPLEKLGAPTVRFNEALFNAVEAGIREVLGETGLQFIYGYLERNFSLKRDEIPEKLEVFSGGLETLLGSGAKVVRQRIYNNLFSYSGERTDRDKEFLSFLRKVGNCIHSPAAVFGQYGTKHSFDLFAEYRVAVKIVRGGSGREVGPEEVLKAFTEAYDVGANEVVLIAVPRMGEKARRLADRYRIRWMEAPSVSQARRKINWYCASFLNVFGAE